MTAEINKMKNLSYIFNVLLKYINIWCKKVSLYDILSPKSKNIFCDAKVIKGPEAFEGPH